jgi:AcrR family transcriptional regulator
MDARTQKSEMTRAAIVGAALDLAASDGLEAITLQAVADRIGISKSGVFSRVGSREALQKAVIEEFGRRFVADVFVPAMQVPKGLPRLSEIVRRWLVRLRDVEAHKGCLYTSGAFELDDREGELRELGQLQPDTDPEQLVGEICSLAIGLVHDVRFLRDPRAAERAQATWLRLVSTYES